jgi:hypothetical protein
MSTDDSVVAELMRRLETLEAQNPTNSKTPIDGEIWLVYDPTHIQVWCSKVECPHLNRTIEKEVIAQTVTVDENLATILDADVGDEVDVGIEVRRVSSPRTNHHPLGVVAAFATEREAAKWVENTLKRHRFDESKQDQHFCITQVML